METGARGLEDAGQGKPHAHGPTMGAVRRYSPPYQFSALSRASSDRILHCQDYSSVVKWQTDHPVAHRRRQPPRGYLSQYYKTDSSASLPLEFLPAPMSMSSLASCGFPGSTNSDSSSFTPFLGSSISAGRAAAPLRWPNTGLGLRVAGRWLDSAVGLRCGSHGERSPWEPHRSTTVPPPYYQASWSTNNLWFTQAGWKADNPSPDNASRWDGTHIYRAP